MIDGAVARKTNSVSDFGSEMDTAADLMFTAAALIKVLPAIHIPGWLGIWVGIVVLIKIGNIISGFIVFKRFISLHTIMNKVTGLLLFLLPLIISFTDLKYVALVVCSVATFSAIQEGFNILRGCESR